jgi:hypothetical protein
MSITVIALTAGILGLLLVIGAGPVYRNGAPLLVAFASLGLGALLGAIGAVAGIGAVLAGLRRGQPLAFTAVTGLIFGLVAFGVPFQRVWSARTLPSIHDISTDLANPPTFQAVLPIRQGAANGVEFSAETAAAQRRAYPDIATVAIAGSPGEVFDRAIDAARDMNWEVVGADRASGRLEATDTTRWFGFKDDIVVRIAPDGVNTKVDVRSVSRVGRGDLGANAERIRDFLGRLRG